MTGMRPVRVHARLSAIGIMLSLLSACATPALAPGADKVLLTQKAADVANCTAVGNINPARDARGGTTFSTPAEFQYQAIGLNGNTVCVTALRWRASSIGARAAIDAASHFLRGS